MPNATARPGKLSRLAAASLTAALMMGQSAFVAAQPAEPQSAAVETTPSDVELAERHAADAFAAYEAGRYGTAVSLYVQAYNASPNADILYNIARIYDTKLGDRKLALTFYRRYIADPGAQADRIKLANERLITLREAEIAAEQTGPSRPSPGRALGSAGSTATPTDEDRWSNQELVGAIVGAGGVVGVVIGGAFGVAAISNASTARDLCDGNACREQRGVTAARDANQNARVATVGFAAGGALLAIGTALFLSADEPKERAQATRVRWTPVASESSVALEVAGAW
jgi:tetratricopeptide (TPR) repeat protein